VGVQRVAQISYDTLPYILDQIRVPEAEKAAQEEGADDKQRKKAQGLGILLGENVVKYVLDQERQCPIGSAEKQHADESSGEPGE
jgi:hypothetical protein